MNLYFAQLLQILANPPGGLVLSIIFIIILVGSLWRTTRRTDSDALNHTKRVIIGIGILIILQGILLWINLLAWLKVFDPQWFLPSIDRAFVLINMIWIAWLWVFSEPSREKDRIPGIFTILTLTLMVISILSWLQKPTGTVFIYSIQDILWQILTLVLIILALTFLLIHKPIGYHHGLAVMVLSGLGNLIYLLIPMPVGYYLGVIRLTQLVVFPFLLALPRAISAQVIPQGKVKEKEKTGVSDQQLLVNEAPIKINPPPFIPGLIDQAAGIDQNHLTKVNLIRSLEAKEASPRSDQIELQLHMTLEELAFLQNELAAAKIKIDEFENQEPVLPSISEDQIQMVASIAQELRQPMSSIVGYTDLLMGESIGLLGALQRKFLERVKFSSERIVHLIEDLIQLTSNETDRIIMNPEVIDLNNIIDNAVAYTSTQLREKNITMRLDIPESPPKIHIDREALQQILIHLLQNAGAATLIEGTVLLRVHIQTEDEKDFLLIQVKDSGGGILSKDLPKVFARRYRAENVLIQGLGDTGVGLSIAKTLAEAQFGRIWVDTSLGVGSMISVLLPIVSSKSEIDE